MKKILMLLLVAAPWASAHDHMEVGEDPSDTSRLGMDGPGYQLGLYVPPGEPFSGYLPDFPGGWFASELTFSSEVNVLQPAAGAIPRIDLISVSGPTGGHFSFWEVGATTPTWEIPAGWTNSPGNSASLHVILNGDNHVHGRAFTMDWPGVYTVVLQAVDEAGGYLPSSLKVITFVAQQPPPLSLRIENGGATVSFTSRLNLDYDLQSCTNLDAGAWLSEVILFGDGAEKTNTLPLAGQPFTFYRLVEFR